MHKGQVQDQELEAGQRQDQGLNPSLMPSLKCLF